MASNNLKEIRESQMLSKAELAKKAGLSVQTIARIEYGMPCRLDTQRKILLALGMKLQDRKKVFCDYGMESHTFSPLRSEAPLAATGTK